MTLIQNSFRVATLTTAILAAGLVSGPAMADSSANDAFSIEDLKVNPRNGTINASVKRLRNTGRTPVKVEFTFGETTEVVQGRGIPLNQARNVTSKTPFPCNEELPVHAKLVSPDEYAGIYLEKTLTRKCKAGNYSGTPNLVVVNLERKQRGETNARAPSQVNVRVTVANDAPYGMPNNEQGGNTWYISVQGDSRAKQMRRALPGKSKNPRNKSNQYAYNTNITLSCWSRPEDKYADVKVTVDSRNNIRESNENDNSAVFQILRNRCRDAG